MHKEHIPESWKCIFIAIVMGSIDLTGICDKTVSPGVCSAASLPNAGSSKEDLFLPKSSAIWLPFRICLSSPGLPHPCCLTFLSGAPCLSGDLWRRAEMPTKLLQSKSDVAGGACGLPGCLVEDSHPLPSVRGAETARTNPSSAKR